jgi:thiamine pyrophosphate-dependent acetolactate synthase large subunit-like protein
MNVAEALAAELAGAGVRRVFAVMGDANMRLLVALLERGVDVVFARHEAAAVAAADGYARLTGSTGVCSVTAGPGLALTALPLVTAARRGSPLLLIAGDAPEGDAGNIHRFDERRFVEGLGLVVQSVLSADTAVADLRFAIETAAGEHAPVVLRFPYDLADAVAVAPTGSPAINAAGRRSAFLPHPLDLAAAADRLLEAQHPVLLAGRGAAEDHAGAELERLAEQLGAPVFTTLPARGVVDEEAPWVLGVAGGYASDHGMAVLAKADVLLVVGASLSPFTTVHRTLFPQATLVRIDAAPPSPSRAAPPAAVHLLGTATATLAVLADAVAGRLEAPRASYSKPAVESPEPEPMVSGLLNPAYLLHAADRMIPDDAIVVIGVGHFSSFAVQQLRPARRRFVFTHEFGAIGQGLPMALGAAAADAGPVVLVEGDASLMMCVQELDTAVRAGLPLRIIVVDDEAIGAEYHKLRAEGLDGASAVLPTPDLAVLARAFGADGALARDPEELTDALARFSSAAGVFVLDGRVSRDVVSDLYRRRHPRLNR